MFPSATIYTYFKGGARAEKRVFLVTISKKSLIPPFLAAFSKLCMRRRNFRPKLGLCNALGELNKSIWSTEKKGRQNFRSFFLKIRPTKTKS